MTKHSRRRFLGLATGVSAAALGSSALVGESVAYTNSGTFSTADGFDLLVEWRSEYNGSTLDSRSGDDAIPLWVENALPGDSGALFFRAQIDGDEARSATIEVEFYNTDATGGIVSKENGRNNPELEAGDTTPDSGELLDAVDARAWYDTGPLGLSFLGGCNGSADLGESIVAGSLRDVTEELAGGFSLPDDGCLAAEQEICFGVEWWLDEGVGNKIQGDSVDLSLSFTARECDEE